MESECAILYTDMVLNSSFFLIGPNKELFSLYLMLRIMILLLLPKVGLTFTVLLPFLAFVLFF